MRQEVVDIERFNVWQYLIERLGAKRAHSVKQVSSHVYRICDIGDFNLGIYIIFIPF